MAVAGVVPNTDPRQIITPLVLVGLGLGVGEGLGLGNHIAISTRGNNLAGGRKWAQHRQSASEYKHFINIWP